MSAPQLTYAVYPDQDPIQASPQTGPPSILKLMVVVSNSTGQKIYCQSISFSFLQGGNAKDLFSDSTGISTTTPKGWSLKQSGALFMATPDTPGDGTIGPNGLTFVISGIRVNQQAGTTYMTITEVTTNPTNTGTLDYPLAKFPQQFEVGALTATPPIVAEGSSTTLFWSGTSGATYEIQYVDENDNTITISHPQGEPTQPLPSSGNYTVENLQVTPSMTFYLLVTVQIPEEDDSVTLQRECTVTVKAPKPTINSFTITANPVIPGQPLSFILNWDIIGSFQITANDGQHGTERVLPIPKGATSYVVYPTQLTTTYTLTVFPTGLVRAEENHGKQ